MDSVTQFALGAVVSTAFLGRHIGPKKAALLGGVMGTLPDMDTFIRHENPVDSFTLHRGATHSLVIQLLATPLFGEPLVRISEALRDHRIRTYLAVYLMFATHALIDAMTVYGTRIFWPIIEEPFGVGSIFIIDPLYTLPLLIMTLWAAFKRDWTDSFARKVNLALIVSTAYMGLSIGLQMHADSKASDWLKTNNVQASRALTIPNPFNILFWRTIVVGDGYYLNLYASTFGDDFKVYEYKVRDDLRPCLAKLASYQHLNAFSKGFTAVTVEENKVVVSDLRMGLTPQYVFRFYLADIAGASVSEAALPERLRVARSSEGDTDWLIAGILARQTTRPREEAAYIEDVNNARQYADASSASCSRG